MYLLILHFKGTSLKSGTTYQDVSEVKRHFSNWFQANHAKKALLQFINDGKKAERQARVFLFPLIAKTNFYFDTLLKRQCTSANHVLEFKENLTSAQTKLDSKRLLLSKSTERESVETLLSDISIMLKKLTNAELKGQLDWFCLKKATVEV